MTDVTYTVEPDIYGDPTIWKYQRPNDPQPKEVLTDNRSSNSHPEGFRAAAAVLAPDDEVVELVAERLFSEHQFNVSQTGEQCSCGDSLDNVYEHDVRAVLAALKEHATGADH